MSDVTVTWPTGVGPHPDLVDGLCHLILDEIITFANEVGWPLPGDDAPVDERRRYVSPGPPPWDCEQVTVHADAQAGHLGAVDLPGSSPMIDAAGWALRTVVIEVQIVRCLTAWADDTGSRLALDRLPPVSVDEADARLHNGDPQVVLGALIRATSEDRISPDGDWMFLGAQSLPDGDMVGQIIRFVFGAETLALWVNRGS